MLMCTARAVVQVPRVGALGITPQTDFNLRLPQKSLVGKCVGDGMDEIGHMDASMFQTCI